MNAHVRRRLPSGWMTVRSVAARLGLTQQEIRDLATSGVIPYHQPGPDGRLAFRLSEIEAWLTIDCQRYGL